MTGIFTFLAWLGMGVRWVHLTERNHRNIRGTVQDDPDTAYQNGWDACHHLRAFFDTSSRTEFAYRYSTNQFTTVLSDLHKQCRCMGVT